MSFTITSPVGQQLFDMLAPWANDDMALYLDGIGRMFDPIALLVQEQGTEGDPDYIPAWGRLFDPDLCPAGDLPYLAQFVGVTIPVGTPEATARSLVKAEAGMNRGTPASIMAAIERNISTVWAPSTTYAAGVLVTFGTPPVFYRVTTGFTSGTSFATTNLAVTDPRLFYALRERQRSDGTADAYYATIQVRPEQLTPTNTAAALISAVNAVKPGGIVMQYVVSDSPRIEDATKTFAAVGSTITLANAQTSDV